MNSDFWLRCRPPYLHYILLSPSALLLAEQGVCGLGLRKGHEAPARYAQWAVCPVFLHYGRVGNGDGQTCFLNQALSAMDRHQAKHKERQWVSRTVSFPSSSRTDEPEGDERFCGVTPTTLPAQRIPAKAGPLRLEGESSLLGVTPLDPQGHWALMDRDPPQFWHWHNNHHCCLVGPTTAQRPCSHRADGSTGLCLRPPPPPVPGTQPRAFLRPGQKPWARQAFLV